MGTSWFRVRMNTAPLPVMLCCHMWGCELQHISSSAVLAGRANTSGCGCGRRELGELLQKSQGKPFPCRNQSPRKEAQV